MKQSFLFALFMLLTFVAFSQKPFEGTIVYALHTNDTTEKNPDAEMTLIFGKNIIMAKFKENNSIGYDKDEMIIYTDSGKIYSINRKDSTFRKVNNIASVVKMQPSVPLVINGYHTTPIQYLGGGFHRFTRMLENGSMTIYVSDSLFYPVPEQYAQSEFLIMLNKNKIVLGFDIAYPRRNWQVLDEDADSATTLVTATARAKEIIPQTFAVNEIGIPSGFKKYVYHAYVDSTIMMADSMAMADSAAKMMMDTTAVKAKRTTKSKYKKPVQKTKTTIKSPAKKPD